MEPGFKVPFLFSVISSTLFSSVPREPEHIYVAYSKPNGWTDWTEILCGRSWVAEGCYRLKNSIFFCNFFLQATPGFLGKIDLLRLLGISFSKMILAILLNFI